MTQKEKDFELIRNIQRNGCEKSMSILYNTYKPKLEKLMCYKTFNTKLQGREEDIVQDAFVKAFEKIKHFKEDVSFYAWMSRICVNSFIDLTRRNSTKLQNKTNSISENDESMDSPMIQIPSRELNPYEKYKVIDMQMLIEEIFNDQTLKNQVREIAKNRFIKELSYNDISDKMNIPLGTVKTSIRKMKAVVQNKYKEKYNFTI